MQFSPLSKIETKRHLLVLAPFTISAPWAGLSELKGYSQIQNTRPLSFKLPISAQDSYVLAVRWSISPYVYRYLLWDDVGELLPFPLYTGQTIGVNAYLEVWNVNGSTDMIQPTNLNLYVSWLSEPNIDRRCFNNEYSTLLSITPV